MFYSLFRPKRPGAPNQLATHKRPMESQREPETPGRRQPVDPGTKATVNSFCVEHPEFRFLTVIQIYIYKFIYLFIYGA